MSIYLTDALRSKAINGKLADAEQIFLEGDTQNVEKEIKDINSRHDTLNTKHESLSKTVQGISATGKANTATEVTYNNTNSGIVAENIQDAVDKLAANNRSQDAEIAKKANSADVTSQIQTEQTRVNAELDKKFNSKNIAQESGESEDRVMSQKAVSTQLSNLVEQISDFYNLELKETKKRVILNGVLRNETSTNSSYHSIFTTEVKAGDIIYINISSSINSDRNWGIFENITNGETANQFGNIPSSKEVSLKITANVDGYFCIYSYLFDEEKQEIDSLFSISVKKRKDKLTRLDESLIDINKIINTETFLGGYTKIINSNSAIFDISECRGYGYTIELCPINFNANSNCSLSFADENYDSVQDIIVPTTFYKNTYKKVVGTVPSTAKYIYIKGTFRSSIFFALNRKERIFVDLSHKEDGAGSMDSPFNSLTTALSIARDGDTIILQHVEPEYSILTTSVFPSVHIMSEVPININIDGATLQNKKIYVEKNITLSFSNSTIESCLFSFNGGTLYLGESLTCEKCNDFIGDVRIGISNIISEKFFKRLYLSWLFEVVPNSISNKDTIKNESTIKNLCNVSCPIYVDGDYCIKTSSDILSVNFKEIYGTSQKSILRSNIYNSTSTSIKYRAINFMRPCKISGIDFYAINIKVGDEETEGISITKCNFNDSPLFLKGLVSHSIVKDNIFNGKSTLVCNAIFECTIDNNIFGDGLNGVISPRGRTWQQYNITLHSAARCVISNNKIHGGITAILNMITGYEGKIHPEAYGFKDNLYIGNFIEKISEESLSFDATDVLDLAEVKNVSFSVEKVNETGYYIPPQTEINYRIDIILTIELSSTLGNVFESVDEKISAFNITSNKDGSTFNIEEMTLGEDSTYYIKVRLKTEITSTWGSINNYLTDGEVDLSKCKDLIDKYHNIFLTEDIVTIAVVNYGNRIVDNKIKGMIANGFNKTWGAGIGFYSSSCNNVIANNSVECERIKLTCRNTRPYTINSNNVISNNVLIDGAIELDTDVTSNGITYGWNNMVSHNIMSGAVLGQLLCLSQNNLRLIGNIIGCRFSLVSCKDATLIGNTYSTKTDKATCISSTYTVWADKLLE